MPQSLFVLLPALTFAASTAGAGLLAARLFDALRRRFPPPFCRPANWLIRQAYRALHAPRYARLSALLLAAAISLSCSGLAAALTHSDVALALDAALAAVMSQVVHGWGLRPTVEVSR